MLYKLITNNNVIIKKTKVKGYRNIYTKYSRFSRRKGKSKMVT